MRSAEKIKETLSAIEEAWLAHPELRLGQLLVNAVASEQPCPELFHMPDAALVCAVRDFAHGAEPEKAPRQVSLSNGAVAIVTPANSMQGILCRAFGGGYFLRVRNQEGFVDYDIRHSDASIRVEDAEAFIYQVGDECWLDHAPETLGLKESTESNESK